MDRDETATYAGEPGESAPAGGVARRLAPLQVRDRGRYAVIAEHGRGGIGRVLRATDLEFGRDVALKELLIRTPTSEVRFMREAIITARLEHPNIVPVHEAGKWPDGTPFYAMKLVSGRPLKALIDEAKTYADRVALLERVLAVADAIAYAHARGVIHRDLKPSNIIVGEYGETIVIDWGLAKTVTDTDEVGQGADASVSPDVTVAGSVLGTPAYMAPEQAAGGGVTERSDIYALGAILIEVLGGRASRLAAGTASAGVSGGTTDNAGIAATPAQVAPDIPADLQSIAHCAMAPEPRDRYPCARAFADDIRRFLARAGVQAHRYTLRERAGRWLGAHRRLVQGATAVIVALLVASTAFLSRESRLREDAETARRAAESERDRADRQTLALLEQQGRTELAAGRPFRAAPFLAEAYRRQPDDLPVRWLLTEALHALDSLALTFDATPPASSDGTQKDAKTYTVSLSPDDRELVTGQQFSIGFWDPATGALRRRLSMATDGHLVQYSEDGARLLVMVSRRGGDSPARILDTRTGEELAAIPVGNNIEWFSWAPDGRHLAVVDDGGKVTVWATEPRPTRLFSFPGPPAIYGCMVMSPDGAMLAVRGIQELILASVPDGQIHRIAIPGEDIKYLMFSPDSKTILATMAERSVRTWDARTGQQQGRFRQAVAIPEHARFTSGGSMVTTIDSEAIHVWDLGSTTRLTRLDTLDGVFAATSIPQGTRLVTTTSRGVVRVWDLPRDRWARSLPDHLGRSRATYVANGARILTVDEGQGASGRVRVWRATDGEVESTSSIRWNASCGITASRDGRLVAVRAENGGAIVIDTVSGDVTLRIDAGADAFTDLAFDPENGLLATADAKGVRVWSTVHGTAAGVRLDQPDVPIDSVTFSANGRYILTTGVTTSTRIWDATTGKLVLDVPDSGSHAAEFNAGGTRIVVGGRGPRKPPSVFDARTGQLLARLEAPTDRIDAVALSPDGSIAATINYNGVIRISAATSGATLRTIDITTEVRLGGNNLEVHSLEFSPDGKRLLVTGDRYVLIWNVEVDTRSADEVDAAVAAKSPWKLVDGRLVRRPE
jgi:eukaryotic-like serine/threonine-protein kinase